MQFGLAPAAVEAGQPVVSLDSLVALVAPAGHVALHPVMLHPLRALGRLDVGGDAGGGGALHAPLVHRVLANWNKTVQILRKHWQTYQICLRMRKLFGI